jgi:hypothetical protein
MVSLGLWIVSAFRSEPLVEAASHEELSGVSVLQILADEGPDISDAIHLKNYLLGYLVRGTC